MSHTSRRSIERIEQILQGLLNHAKGNPDIEIFRVPLREFSAWGPLLGDRDGLEIAFAKINSTTNAVSFKFEHEENGRMMTVTDGVVSSGYEVVKIHVEDIGEIEDYLTNLNNGSSARKQSIDKLVLLRPEDSRVMRVIINNDYAHPLEVGGSYWDKFYLMVEKQGLPAVGNKGLRDYFNSNKECQLYSKTGFVLTKLIGAKGGMLVPLIPIEIITEVAYKRRLNSA